MIDKMRILLALLLTLGAELFALLHLSYLSDTVHAYNIDKQFIITCLFVESVKEIVPFWNPKELRSLTSSPSVSLFKAHVYFCLHSFTC